MLTPRSASYKYLNPETDYTRYAFTCGPFVHTHHYLKYGYDWKVLLTRTPT